MGGLALSQISNVGPDMRQGYIADSFMVVVLGGVGQLAGAVWAALGLGIFSKILEGWAGAVIAKIVVLVFIIIFIQKRPQGLFALKGRFVELNYVMPNTTQYFAQGTGLADSAPDQCARPQRLDCHGYLPDPRAARRTVAASGRSGRERIAHLDLRHHAFVGKIMCYAIVAVAMDLIWGFGGILSLGHGIFFALGGYAFGMYLMRQIGRDGSYHADLPDFMVFLDWKKLPWYWSGSDSFRGR